ncbi:MAG: RDD family protein [Acidobacteriaceae bacterium]|jgi:uncharacterized RDD family membrane protein YckC
MRGYWKAGKFHPHEPARAEALAGVALASFGARAAAFAIDFFLVVLAYSPLYIGFRYLLLRLRGVNPKDINIHLEFGFHDIGSLVALVVYFGLLAYWWNGRTIGKRLLKIRAVSLIGERITLWQSVERALGYGASALEGGFGFVQYFIHRNHCCVHDRIAETIVVKEPRNAVAVVVEPANMESV